MCIRGRQSSVCLILYFIDVAFNFTALHGAKSKCILRSLDMFRFDMIYLHTILL